MMGKTSIGGSKSSSHHIYKDKARNRIDDLQGIFKDIQVARNESRTDDVIFLEEQVNQMLSQWKNELNEPTPASSQNDGSLSSFSSDLFRLLQPLEDDATSGLDFLTNPKPETEINTQSSQVGDQFDFYEDYFLNQAQLEPKSTETEQLKGSFLGHNMMEMSTPLDNQQYNVGHDVDHNFHIDSDGTPLSGESSGDQISIYIRTVDLPSAFLGPKCALWDCSRPAKGLEGCQDYCDNSHLYLASEESPPGRAPIMRSGGIDLVDGHIFAVLKAKAQGKVVGIPECEGAATMNCPWNSPELFDLSWLEGETLREWLFFDKPRRAFASGNRKQRSLPDHSGRGWHESTKKQIMKEFDGQKRSYLMEPQPLYNFKWHLYVYELNNNDVCALYRLELKLVEEKKSLKGKVVANPVAEFPAVDDRSFTVGENNFLNDVEHTPGTHCKSPTNESCFYGDNFVNLTVQEHGSQGFDHYESSPSEMQYLFTNNLEVTNQLDYHHFETHRVFDNNNSTGFAGSGQCDTSGLQPSVCHASYPFIRSKCALWDCLRPAHGAHGDYCRDFCGDFHDSLALAEGSLSTTPILRPGGISLKDGPLFASLRAKLQGMDVGIPICEGAATMKSPWNDPKHFNISLFEGETIREWLFFDKPRKAFESGNRKQRLLPDYKGRWHGSRNKAIQEFGGIKRSYYMDPQPEEFVGWHLYEYAIDNHDAHTLFRLELKVVDKKTSPKGKVTKVSISDLQKQMGRLTAEAPADTDLSVTNTK